MKGCLEDLWIHPELSCNLNEAKAKFIKLTKFWNNIVVILDWSFPAEKWEEPGENGLQFINWVVDVLENISFRVLFLINSNSETSNDEMKGLLKAYWKTYGIDNVSYAIADKDIALIEKEILRFSTKTVI